MIFIFVLLLSIAAIVFTLTYQLEYREHAKLEIINNKLITKMPINLMDKLSINNILYVQNNNHLDELTINKIDFDKEFMYITFNYKVDNFSANTIVLRPSYFIVNKMMIFELLIKV